MTLTAQQRHLLAWLAIAVAASALLWLLAPVLTPFIVAAVLAYALHPTVERLSARGVPRLASVVVLEAAVVLALLALLLLVVPILTKELPLLREQIPLLAAKLNDFLAPWLKRLGLRVSLDIDSIRAFVFRHFNANWDDWMATALASVRIGGSYVLALIGNAVLVPVVLFYLLYDWPQLVQRTLRLVPPRLQPRVVSFLGECDAVLGQYLRGQLLVMVLLAVFYSVGLALFRFDLALPVGVFTGLAVFIPYLGFGLGLVLALLAGLLQFGNLYAVVAVAVVYGVGQVVESVWLTPRLVGERIGLHPIAVIFALLAFGELFGFVGVLVALPLSALLVVAARRLSAVYLASELYQG